MQPFTFDKTPSNNSPQVKLADARCDGFVRLNRTCRHVPVTYIPPRRRNRHVVWVTQRATMRYNT